jgi:short-subunit dehydrogenase
MSEKILVLGATSGIAEALCRVLAARGCSVIVAGRDISKLERIAADLGIRNPAAQARAESFDALDFAGHAAFFERCLAHVGGDLDGVILCYGYLADQATAQADFDETHRTIDVNFTSAVSILDIAARCFEARGRGYIAAISSVAGDRGRQSNYTYGAAKAGLTAYLSGLRNRLFHAGVHVLTIKPGFVYTAMTEGKVNPKSPLVASPEKVARDIDRAIRRRRNVLYAPWFWRIILGIVCAIPEGIFKRLRM